MKPFASWVAEMANSIEDTSTFIKSDVVITRVLAPTEMQARAFFADAVVQQIHDLDDVSDWLSLFCTGNTGEKGKKRPTSSLFSKVLGDSKTLEYFKLNEDNKYECVAWWTKFRQDITDGWEPLK